MDSESNVIAFPKIERAIQTISLVEYKILSPEEFLKIHPEIAEAMGCLDQDIDEEPHTAEIIDAKDPEIWKKKTNNKE